MLQMSLFNKRCLESRQKVAERDKPPTVSGYNNTPNLKTFMFVGQGYRGCVLVMANRTPINSPVGRKSLPFCLRIKPIGVLHCSIPFDSWQGFPMFYPASIKTMVADVLSSILITSTFVCRLKDWGTGEINQLLISALLALVVGEAQPVPLKYEPSGGNIMDDQWRGGSFENSNPFIRRA